MQILPIAHGQEASDPQYPVKIGDSEKTCRFDFKGTWRSYNPALLGKPYDEQHGIRLFQSIDEEAAVICIKK